MSHETQDLEQEIMQTLLKSLNELPGKTAEVTPQTNLTADMKIDSIDMMELLMEVEDTFDVSFPLNMMANINTVREFADQIKQLVEGQA